MQLHNRHKIDATFSMSSMTDIVFLLLIFFMLTISSVTPQALSVDLPTSDNTNNVLPQINVTITQTLDYYVDNKPVKRAALADTLQKSLSDHAQKIVLLYIDKTVPVEHMVYVTDIAAALNAQVSVATQPNLHGPQ